MSNDEKDMGGSLGHCRVCGRDAVVVYPLLRGSPAFCVEHHNPRDAGPFGCDFTGPDDFDILDYPDNVFVGDRKTFVWSDRDGVEHELRNIDDQYLQNIINFLRRRLAVMDVLSAAYWDEVVVFLEKEKRIRTDERKHSTEHLGVENGQRTHG